jgi:hypothetical protein
LVGGPESGSGPASGVGALVEPDEPVAEPDDLEDPEDEFVDPDDPGVSDDPAPEQATKHMDEAHRRPPSNEAVRGMEWGRWRMGNSPMDPHQHEPDHGIARRK